MKTRQEHIHNLEEIIGYAMAEILKIQANKMKENKELEILRNTKELAESKLHEIKGDRR